MGCNQRILKDSIFSSPSLGLSILGGAKCNEESKKRKNMTTKEGGLRGLVYAENQQEMADEGLVLTMLKWLDPICRVVQGSEQGPIVISIS